MYPLTYILELIKRHLPLARRISAYCLPRNLKNKSVAELKELRQLGLSLLYVGCETGDAVFRSDHASNYLILKGVPGKDKLKLLDTVSSAIQRRGIIPLREERFA